MGNYSKKELAIYKLYFLNDERLKNRLLHTYVVAGRRLLQNTVALIFNGGNNFQSNVYISVQSFMCQSEIKYKSKRPQVCYLTTRAHEGY